MRIVWSKRPFFMPFLLLAAIWFASILAPVRCASSYAPSYALSEESCQTKDSRLVSASLVHWPLPEAIAKENTAVGQLTAVLCLSSSDSTRTRCFSSLKALLLSVLCAGFLFVALHRECAFFSAPGDSFSSTLGYIISYIHNVLYL